MIQQAVESGNHGDEGVCSALEELGADAEEVITCSAAAVPHAQSPSGGAHMHVINIISHTHVQTYREKKGETETGGKRDIERERERARPRE